MWIRYGALVLLTGAAGVLSGLLWLVPNGLMAGALGMCLSLGTIWLGRLQTRQNGELALRQVLMVGFAVGLLAGGLMAGISELATAGELATGRSDDLGFGPSRLPLWAPLIMGVAYGVVIHWSYWRRRFSRRPWRDTFVRTVGLCFLLKAVATPLYLIGIETTAEIPGVFLGSALLSLMGAVPFALLWVWITARLDPAWSSPHWPAAAKGQTPAPPPDR